jgi:hypothetical protein
MVNSPISNSKTLEDYHIAIISCYKSRTSTSEYNNTPIAIKNRTQIVEVIRELGFISCEALFDAMFIKKRVYGADEINKQYTQLSVTAHQLLLNRI